MSPREAMAWGLLRVALFSYLVAAYWDPIPGIAWLMLFVVFTGGVRITLT